LSAAPAAGRSRPHLGEQIRAFHLDALAAQVSLAVDFDTTLTVDRRRRLP
jgi:hypothetical protein